MQAIAAPASIDPGVWAAIPEAARSDVLLRCARQLRRGKSPADALALALSDLGIASTVSPTHAPTIPRTPETAGRSPTNSRPAQTRPSLRAHRAGGPLRAVPPAATKSSPMVRSTTASAASEPVAVPTVAPVRRAAGLRPGIRSASIAPAHRETAIVVEATTALVAGLVAEGVDEADAVAFADAAKADPVMAASAPLGVHVSTPYLPTEIRRAVEDRISDLGFAEYDRLRVLRRAGVKVDFIDPDDPSSYRDEDPCDPTGSARP